MSLYMFYGKTIVVKDALGNEFKFTKKIQRIISLSPAVTESVFLLGKGKLLVGVTKFCERPPEALKIEKTGGVIDPNIEKIVSLNPDVVIGIDQFSVVKRTEALKSYGIKVFMLDKRSGFESLVDEMTRLGILLDVERLSKKYIDDAEKEISAIRIKLKNVKNKPKVFWQIGAQPIFTAGDNTFPGNMIKLAGGINVAADINGYMEFSVEKIIEVDPDVIVSPEMGSLKNNIKLWDNYPSLKSYRNERIHIIDEHESSSPTIVTFVETVKRLYGYFYETPADNK